MWLKFLGFSDYRVGQAIVVSGFGACPEGGSIFLPEYEAQRQLTTKLWEKAEAPESNDPSVTVGTDTDGDETESGQETPTAEGPTPAPVPTGPAEA